LTNEDALKLSRNLDEAYWNLERVEHFAEVCYLAKMMMSGERS